MRRRMTIVIALVGILVGLTACQEQPADVERRLEAHELFFVRSDGVVLEEECWVRTVFQNGGCQKAVAVGGELETLISEYQGYFDREGWQLICVCNVVPSFRSQLRMRSATEFMSVTFTEVSSWPGDVPEGKTYVLKLLVSEREE